MRKNKSQLRAGEGSPKLPIKGADTSGNPGESYTQGHRAVVRRDPFRPLRKSAPDLTLMEIRDIEAQVRKALYP
jgi:hypothetical protein